MRTMKNISKEYYRKRAMKEEGVTILSLVITIIVLLILSGITIKLALDDNGIVGQSKNAGLKYQNASVQEQVALNQATQAIADASNGSIGSGGSGSGSESGGSSSGNSDEVNRLKKQIEELQQQVTELEATQATGGATVDQVIQGATFSNSSESGLTGTMKNNGAWTTSTTGNGRVTVPEGYHNGNGYVDLSGAYNSGVEAGKKAVKESPSDFGLGKFVDLGTGTSFNIVSLCKALGIDYTKLSSSNFLVELAENSISKDNVSGTCNAEKRVGAYYRATFNKSYDAKSGILTTSLAATMRARLWTDDGATRYDNTISWSTPMHAYLIMN